MESYIACTGVTAYGFIHMKEQIKVHFVDKIIIPEVAGKPTVLTMWIAVSTIFRDFYSSPKQESSEPKKQKE